MSEWISVKDKLPEENTQVNVVWVNHRPVAYYADIKDKPFVSSAVYFQGNWYWWSTFVEDLIDEYDCEAVKEFEISEDIEITHWMPLPELPAHDREPSVSDDMRDHLRAYIAGAEDY